MSWRNQDGDNAFNTRVHSTRRLGCLHRSEGHLPSHQIHPRSRKYLRFLFQGKILQFKVLPLGLTTAPFIFTKLIMAVAAHIRKTGSLVIQYFDDWLLHSASYPINSQSNICLANNTNIRSDPKYRIVGTNTDSDLHRAFIRI